MTPGNLSNHMALFHRVSEASKATAVSESPEPATIPTPNKTVSKTAEKQQSSIEKNIVGFTMVHVNNKFIYNCNSCAYSTPQQYGVKNHLTVSLSH
jgi:hypothetical protein